MYEISYSGMSDAEFEQYYSDLKEMFNSKGWKQLITDLNEVYGLHNSVDLIPANQTLEYHKGFIKALNWTLCTPDRLEDEAEKRGQKTL